MTDLIDRQAAIDVLIAALDDDWESDYAVDRMNELPPAEPCNMDEWCEDCKEYDHEKHCCPRFNRVIRAAMEEAKGEGNAT